MQWTRRFRCRLSTKHALHLFCRWRTRSSHSTSPAHMSLNIFRLLGPCALTHTTHLLTCPNRGFGPPGLHIHIGAQDTDNQIMPRCVSPCPRVRRRALTLADTGISFKTQALYVLVFATRYIDLFFRWISLYNFAMKIFFIASSCYILYLMKYRFR